MFPFVGYEVLGRFRRRIHGVDIAGSGISTMLASLGSMPGGHEAFGSGCYHSRIEHVPLIAYCDRRRTSIRDECIAPDLGISQNGAFGSSA
jgi:hypothetical protein